MSEPWTSTINSDKPESSDSPTLPTAPKLPEQLPEQLDDTRLNDRLHLLRSRVFEELGAGFYSFGTPKKSAHYNAARAQVGAMLALLYSQPQKDGDKKGQLWLGEISVLEHKLLPAFSTLLRKIEKSPPRSTQK